MADQIVSADETALRRDLAAGRFISGQAMGRWTLMSIGWPYAFISVRAADGIDYGLRFECAGYPHVPVTAQPWDIVANQPLAVALWPTGASRVPLAFNPGWKSGCCLYIPCDRQSIEGHDGWRNDHPALLWDPTKGICKYLGIVHQLLNSGDYGGRRAA